jgi:uncharacterized protein YecT (DUF1311 family)
MRRFHLERFSKNDVPQTTADDAPHLAGEMNAIYQKITQAPAATFDSGTVRPQGIRDAQRSWLPLRDAWIDFAKADYPQLSPERVVAQPIRLRLNQLRLLPIGVK